MDDPTVAPKTVVHVKQGTFILLLSVGIMLAIALAWIVRVALMLVFAAIVLATLLTVVLNWLKLRLKMKRGVALTAVLLGISAASTLVVWTSGPSIVRQIIDLQVDLPLAANQLIQRMAGYTWGDWILAQWTATSQISGNFGLALMRMGGVAVSTASVLTGLIVIVVLGVYLAAEPEVYRWWLLSQILSMTSVGIIVSVGLWALGVPLAGTLGVIAALLTFIPNVGPVLSVVPAFMLAIAISPTRALFTILLFLLVHFLEGNVITPLLERRIVRLPPALTMLAQLVLAVIAGPVALAIAAPFAAASLGVLEILLPPDGPVSKTEEGREHLSN